ncbi:triacylglycerol lipase 2-like, partial [Macadamia integrifolia]|uniref:triacylglycerol lipase 2-like n=1 Tax=Macadamia integrifolia TaxID=60698 RepID=UPI001C4FDB76
MGSFMLIRWVALRACFIVLVVVELHPALGWRENFSADTLEWRDDNSPLSDLLRGGEDDSPPVWEGLCKASVIPHGYKCEEFHVTVKDGYILGLQRIPEGLSSSGVAKNKPPVLLQHGVLVDGMSWLLGPPKDSLVFALADSGFDVWISNTRGTRFSKGHVSLDESRPEYWNWSWDEVAENDLPDIIDFVYNQTGDKLHYIGHSMGTTTAMAALSEGLLVDKLSSVSLLCPVGYLNRMTSVAGILASDAFIGELGRLLGVTNFDLGKILAIIKFLPHGKFVAILLNRVANRLGISLDSLKDKLTGSNCCLNIGALDSMINNGLQPTSMKNMVHFAQTFRSVKVRKYDYGIPDANMKHYGKPEAPEYNLRNIPKNLPMFLSFGGIDELADVNDVKHLLEDLNTHDRDKITTQFVAEYAHLDYLFAVNVKEKIYNPIIDFIKAHS